ncbi:MAG: ATP-binding protein [Terrimicrobiaceae bacterium]
MRRLRDTSKEPKAEGTSQARGKLLFIGWPGDGSLVVFDLGKLVKGMRKELRSLLREDIAFDISGLSNEASLVHTNRGQMRDLLRHLVLDARDAMPYGGSLSIVIDRDRCDNDGIKPTFEPTGDYVVVVVRDTESGENAEIPEHGDFRVVKGRGLSLAASYDAIKRCGGHISVSRRAGETVVRIYLPRLPSP